jgi:hypothetical protein
VQRRSAGPHRVAHRANGETVFHPERIGQDEPQVNVADQRAETPVRQAAKRVGGDQAWAESRLVGGQRLIEHGLARLGVGLLAMHGRTR